jgi:hypothetical protein
MVKLCTFLKFTNCRTSSVVEAAVHHVSGARTSECWHKEVKIEMREARNNLLCWEFCYPFRQNCFTSVGKLLNNSRGNPSLFIQLNSRYP